MVKRKHGDPEGTIFGSDEEYFAESKDYPVVKIMYYILINMPWKSKVVLDRERFLKARRELWKKGYISDSEKMRYSFPETLAELKNKWHVISTLPSTVDNRMVKLINPDADIFNIVLKKVDPNAKQRKDFLEKQGKALTDLVKKGEI
jgi:hypothetical protein